MNPKEKILTVVIIIFIIVLLYYISRKSGYFDESCQAAKQDCLNTFNKGSQYCITVSDGNNTTFMTCSIPVVLQLWDCWDDAYPPCLLSYALRNGTIYTIYFYRSDGTLIDYRDGWSPYRLPVKDIDFPITASRCEPGSSGCTVDNGSTMVINNPGCYVVWYFGGLYTTDEICYDS